MPPVMIVFMLPVTDEDLGMQQRVEAIDIQTPRMDLKNGVRPQAARELGNSHPIEYLSRARSLRKVSASQYLTISAIRDALHQY